MRAKITYVVTAAVLVFYFVLVGSRGVLLIKHGTLITVTFGIAVLVLPAIGVWFLWKNTQFVRRANALAAELDAEGGLPVDELLRTPSGRIDRASADAVFERRRARTPRTTGAAGSAWPSPTRTPGTPPGPARPCNERSPCTGPAHPAHQASTPTRPASAPARPAFEDKKEPSGD